MFIIPIPPYSMASQVSGKYRLLMPQYPGLEDVEGRFTIVDNGAFEGHVANADQTYIYARSVDAEEMMLPDILYNMEGTIDLIEEWMQAAPQGGEVNFVPVIQGKDGREGAQCFDYLSERYAQFGVYAIPKHFGVAVRAQLAQTILSEGYAVHYLGWADFSMAEIKQAKKMGVRSMDTSGPFVAAYHGVSVKDNISNLDRPYDYFELEVSEFDSDLVWQNIRDMVAA